MIDVNVWLALTWDRHPQHVPASHWYHSLSDETLFFCRFTMLAFLRLLTNPKVMGDSTTTLEGALQLYDRWMRDPRVALSTEPSGAEILFRRALEPFAQQPATKVIADCYLVGFAEGAGAHIVTFDRGLAATARFQKVPVALIHASGKTERGGPPGNRQRQRSK